ncbi:transporter substrate-binding domain-containing protein [Endozoicomonas sp. SM1973]|uniref:Transporter substrate-binding domain-containing protein n=1 Tax=Spartinivicinus marinus TaxID=2994442 RepID=A0A853I3P6_9GAMM|nr:transporter substrate-binding domain-containing protein [Spartinivicinus marinus]MCX4027166.1 transporter substrate-binding domain-containing protein [Spartinivicinus marinus]NYZ66112.1 transporter substrate-binding domain-containing protein [Spartinivicinus marinus]
MQYKLLLIFWILISPVVLGEERIRIASGEWPPFLSQHYNEYGAGSHIVTEAFALEGIKVVYIFYPWKRSMETAKDGKIDATLLWSKNKDRAKYFLFSDPVLTLRHVFFHRKDLKFNWETIEDLKQYKIGVTRGYFYGEQIQEAADSSLIDVEIGNTDIINFKKLISNRIQLFIIEPEVGYELLAKNFSRSDQKILTNHHRAIQERQWYLLISNKVPRAKEWLERFNKGLAKLKSQGIIDKIMEDVIMGRYSEKLPTISSDQSKPFIVVGDSLHPPFSYLDNGVPKGIYTEIIKQAFKRIGREDITIELMPWKRALHMVKSGKAEGIFPPHYFPAKRPFLGYYSIPIMQEISTVFCNIKNLMKIGINFKQLKAWPDDLKHARFVLSLGVLMGGNKFWQGVNNNEINATKVSGPENAIRKLAPGRLDCHINDRVTIQWYLKALKNKYPSIEIEDIMEIFKIEEEAGYLALSADFSNKDATSFLEKFNSEIQSMKEEGVIQQIIDRNISNAKLPRSNF